MNQNEHKKIEKRDVKHCKITQRDAKLSLKSCKMSLNRCKMSLKRKKKHKEKLNVLRVKGNKPKKHKMTTSTHKKETKTTTNCWKITRKTTTNNVTVVFCVFQSGSCLSVAPIHTNTTIHLLEETGLKLHRSRSSHSSS